MVRGLDRMKEVDLRTTWGQEQEASALLEVLHIFSGAHPHRATSHASPAAALVSYCAAAAPLPCP